MIYHIFNGFVFHLSPALVRGTLANSERISSVKIEEHFFFINMFGKKMLYDKDLPEPYSNICNEYGTKNLKLNSSYLYLILFLLTRKNNDKIILHSCPPLKVFVFISCFLLIFRGKKYRKRFSLICWGSNDFYFPGKNIKERIYKSLFSYLFRDFMLLATLTKEDTASAELYLPKANVIHMPYIASKPRIYNRTRSEGQSPLRIMVSHSGWPHNNHMKSFQLLSRFAGRIEIICPLCYGDKEYIDAVINQGRSLFGDSFHYFTELKTSLEYKAIAQSVDVYITAAERQTGLGALHLTMSGGAKVFSTGNIYKSMSSIGYKIFDIHNLETITFNELATQLPDNIAKANVDMINYHTYDGEKITSLWRYLYKY